MSIYWSPPLRLHLLLRCCCLPAHVAGGQVWDDRAVLAMISPISPILAALVHGCKTDFLKVGKKDWKK